MRRVLCLFLTIQLILLFGHIHKHAWTHMHVNIGYINIH